MYNTWLYLMCDECNFVVYQFEKSCKTGDLHFSV